MAEGENEEESQNHLLDKLRRAQQLFFDSTHMHNNPAMSNEAIAGSSSTKHEKKLSAISQHERPSDHVQEC